MVGVPSGRTPTAWTSWGGAFQTMLGDDARHLDRALELRPGLVDGDAPQRPSLMPRTGAPTRARCRPTPCPSRRHPCRSRSATTGWRRRGTRRPSRSRPRPPAAGPPTPRRGCRRVMWPRTLVARSAVEPAPRTTSVAPDSQLAGHVVDIEAQVVREDLGGARDVLDVRRHCHDHVRATARDARSAAPASAVEASRSPVSTARASSVPSASRMTRVSSDDLDPPRDAQRAAGDERHERRRRPMPLGAHARPGSWCRASR